METYKKIAIEIKGNLLAEIECQKIHSEEERRLWREAQKETDFQKAHEIYMKAAAEDDKACEHGHRVRRLRTALWNMLDILELEYNSFYPELTEIEL